MTKKNLALSELQNDVCWLVVVGVIFGLSLLIAGLSWHHSLQAFKQDWHWNLTTQHFAEAKRVQAWSEQLSLASTVAMEAANSLKVKDPALFDGLKEESEKLGKCATSYLEKSRELLNEAELIEIGKLVKVVIAGENYVIEKVNIFDGKGLTDYVYRSGIQKASLPRFISFGLFGLIACSTVDAFVGLALG